MRRRRHASGEEHQQEEANLDGKPRQEVGASTWARKAHREQRNSCGARCQLEAECGSEVGRSLKVLDKWSEQPDQKPARGGEQARRRRRPVRRRDLAVNQPRLHKQSRRGRASTQHK